MKRLLAACFAVAVLCTNVWAANYTSPYWTTKPVNWRMHNTGARSAPGSKKDVLYLASDDNPWAVDSVSFNKTALSGATIAATEADTTEPVFTSHWTFPPSASGLGGTSIDSTIVCRVFLSDAGATASSIDSCELAIQVSADGKNWVYVNQILNVAGTNPITSTTPTESMFLMLNSAGATTTTPKLFSVAFHTGAETGQYPYRYTWWQWPMARFIVLRKHVTGSAIENLRIFVSHWSCEVQDMN